MYYVFKGSYQLVYTAPLKMGPPQRRRRTEGTVVDMRNHAKSIIGSSVATWKTAYKELLCQREEERLINGIRVVLRRSFNLRKAQIRVRSRFPSRFSKPTLFHFKFLLSSQMTVCPIIAALFCLTLSYCIYCSVDCTSEGTIIEIKIS